MNELASASSAQSVFTLPDLGEGLTEAELVRWLVKVGDAVAIDAPVAEVETAKAMVEVPSPFGGIVTRLHGEEGATLAVGEPLITVDEAGPAGAGTGDGGSGAGGRPGSTADGHGAAAAYREEERAGSGNVLIGYGTSAEVPSRRRRRAVVAPAAGVAVPGAPMPGVAPGPSPSAVREPLTGAPAGAPAEGAPPRPAVVSPIVRKLARQRGVDLAALTGSGPNGLIVRRDVEAAVEALLAAGPAVVAAPGHAVGRSGSPAPGPGRAVGRSGSSAAAEADGGSGHAGSRGAWPAAGTGEVADGAEPAGLRAGHREERTDPAQPADIDRRTGLPVRTRVPLRGVRKAVTETLARSRSEIPEATTWVDVDATALLELRATLPEPPGVLAMVARFVVAGLARFPELNARVDTERGEIVHLDGVHLGLAAQTERGLVVPRVRDAHRRGMRDLDTEIRRLTAAARDGRATAAELTGSSFTLNNYGVLGVDGSAAIINHPEVAILGMGRILPRPWVVDGEIVVRSIVQLSLVFDHRVCDGGTAGGFLRFVADAIEQPVSALADL